MSSRSRELLYDQEAAKAAAAGLGNLPICNLCGYPIDGTRQRWHESHDPSLPRHAGGGVTGIAHERCNLRHNNEHDTPLYWKMKRIRQKHIGAHVPKGRRLPDGRYSNIKIKMDGTVVDRRTGERL